MFKDVGGQLRNLFGGPSPTSRVDALGRLTLLLAPSIGDHLPDRYFTALAPCDRISAERYSGRRVSPRLAPWGNRRQADEQRIAMFESSGSGAESSALVTRVAVIPAVSRRGIKTAI